MNSKELLELIDKQWASTKDIKKIGCVGINKSSKIKREITKELEKQGYKLPYNLVPMDKVVEYFKINIKYFQKVASKKGTE